MVVEATIDGVAGYFALDSGSQLNFLDHAFLKKIRVQKQIFRAGSVVGERVSHIQVGGAVVANVDFVDQNLPSGSALNAMAGVSLSGILGYPALRMLNFAVDFEQMRAWFWGPSQAQAARAAFFGPNAKLEKIPILCQDGWPRIAVTLNDRPFYAVLDTGSTSAAAPKPLRAWFGSDIVVGSKAEQIVSSKGVSRTPFAFARSIGIGNYTYSCARVSPDENGDAPAVIVGWPILSPLHKVLFAFDHGSIEFVPQRRSFDGINTVLREMGLEVYGDNTLRSLPFASSVLPHPIPISDVVSIAGVPLKLIADSSHQNWMTHARMVTRLFEANSNKTYVVYRNSGVLRKILLNRQVHVRSANLPAPIAGAKTFGEGPGIYVAMPGADLQRLPEGQAYLCKEQVDHLEAVGGLPEPKPAQVGNTNLYGLAVPVVEDLQRLAAEDDGDTLTATLAGVKMQPAMLDGKAVPMIVPFKATIRNPTDWAPVPDGQLVDYFPPGWKFPLSEHHERSDHELPSPPDGSVWAYHSGIWLLMAFVLDRTPQSELKQTIPLPYPVDTPVPPATGPGSDPGTPPPGQHWKWVQNFGWELSQTTPTGLPPHPGAEGTAKGRRARPSLNTR